ncbi:Peptidoglycan/xylan/chitin deacetylase, PgdA/CDA1 family [Gracilibacillus orientalis]|uniref:Peptidoglycan/xylan/chitin deacetylase, PgdA/CDA1 family n=1 Tax=Gracilibacillus orientalis TaxID=334253 RepID=A0A1I4GUI8_9BACI|nr:polysaccharide deacetylase family protein [Gracilibacillus orientalis]SFL33180.1 Peptidoglycan/xylan/chitin deacetylase, PgdA/CDA1 family [Gracilibacillus orientalis]
MKKISIIIYFAFLIIISACQSEEVTYQIELKENNEIISSAGKQQLNSEDTGKGVYLTFDDGPTSVTKNILDTLSQFNAKATFFMLEPAMRKYPDVVKRIAEDGHGLGIHGVTHDVNQFYTSEQSALEEMITAQETLQDITDVRSKLIRTPYGSIPYLTESYREVLDSNGFHLWDWNVDSSDWSLSGDKYIDSIVNQIENLASAEETSIVLMHDQEETANHLSLLLTYLSENGFQTKKIGENIEPYNFSCYDRCHSLNSSQN